MDFLNRAYPLKSNITVSKTRDVDFQHDNCFSRIAEDNACGAKEGKLIHVRNSEVDRIRLSFD